MGGGQRRCEWWLKAIHFDKPVSRHRTNGGTETLKDKPMSKDETAIEQEIQDKGLTAPRITPADIDAAIKAEDFHVFTGSQLTVCCMTLQNGFTVTGESACASPANFNAELGQKIARDNARNKIWPLAGYLLRERLHQAVQPAQAPV